MNGRLGVLCLFGLTIAVSGLAAQEPPPDPAADAAKAEANALPRAEDVESLEGIVAALYDVVSGPKGHERDWNRLRSLFAPDAQLIPVILHQNQKAAARSMKLEEFIDVAGPAFDRDGFYEQEIAQKVEQFGHIAHVFSTYEARRAKDEEPFIRGINSIQLFHDGNRWWVLTILWDTERTETPIPEAYLPAS